MNARGDQQVLERAPKTTDLYPVSLALADYDRTRPLIDGRVKPEGIALETECAWIGDFCHYPVYERYDVAEMSLSWYVAARCRGEPVVALPIFPLRMAVHGYIFCRTDAPYTSPKDLVGKRIASSGYRYTVNLWSRGIYKDVYGVSPEQMQWITCEHEGAGYEIPKGIDFRIAEGRTAEDLLFSGEADAVVGAMIPESFLKGDPRIRRLFPDVRAEMRSYYRQTGIFPVTHVMVMKEELAKDQPWIAKNIATAFRESQKVAEELLAEPKRHMFPETVFILEEMRAAYGDNPWPQGLEPNRHVIETFVRYAHEQGYIPRRPSLDELFVANAASL
jgi:4,5-dihydroxyphthalate decarboxylase